MKNPGFYSSLTAGRGVLSLSPLILEDFVNKISLAGLVVALIASVSVFGHSNTAEAQLQIGGSSSNFGTGNLNGGFMPDPNTVSITSGGSLDSRSMTLGSGCVGYVTRQPDYILNYSNAASFLRFFFQGSGDTTLIINDASGNWHCNDDSAGLNPQVSINNPPSGQYDIWVGSYAASANISGTLSITELRSNSVSASVETIEENRLAKQSGSLSFGGSSSNFGSRNLSGGFMPDPSQVAITSGGSLDSRTMSLGPGCNGYVTRQPDFILNYSDAASFLRFFVRAAGSGDTTLIINDAAGNWHCNDDSSGLNPMVSINNPPSGQYDIWVGSYRASENLSSQLFITELRSETP